MSPHAAEQFIDQLYAAFNQRNIDRTLSFMAEDVSWPKASEGGRAEGKAEIRAYWERQWTQINPHVQPLNITELNGKIEVTVHQLVKSLEGEVIFDGEVRHIYTMQNSLVDRMDIA